MSCHVCVCVCVCVAYHIAYHKGREVIGDVAHEFEVLGKGGNSRFSANMCDKLSHIKLFGLEVKLFCLNLGEIEDII